MNWGALARAALYGYLGVSALREARGGGRRRRGLGDRDDPSDEPRARNYDAKNIGQRVKHIVGLIQRGRGDPKVKGVAIQAVSQKCGRDWCIPERDYAGEVRAIFAETRKRVRYVYDARGIDQYVAAKRTMQWGGGDCFPEGTLLLRDDHALVPIQQLKIGERIWGLDRWSEVINVWYKGSLTFDAIKLNNGSWVHLTPNHKVFVATCDRHDTRTEKSQPCSCPISERRIERICVSELQPRMVLLVPDRIPFGKEAMDPDRAYVEGLYLSDGWSDKNSAFFISGQDGCLKEAQKKRVEEICNRLGIPTRWARKYISVKDGAWTLRLHQAGQRAPEKHALSLDLDEGAAGALLRGIMADSGANTHGAGRTFTSTSRMLAVQTRLLHKMFGISCGWSYIEEHGGLGENPIYRLSTREKRPDEKATKLLRVKEIERGVRKGPAWDMTTDDHYVYLPEHDVTVSQCDDYSIVLGSLLGAIGYPVRLRVIRTHDAGLPRGEFNHIYALVGLPPNAPQKWVPLDASVSEPAGWEAPREMVAEYKDYEVP